MIAKQKLMRNTLEALQKDPVLFFEEILGVTTLEEYQKKTLREIAANDKTAISACHAVGKSFMLANVVLWFLSCFPYSKIITTAPTFNQVKNILWSEIRSGHAKSKVPLGGKVNETSWQMRKEGDWFAIGFTPKKEVVSEEGQGKQSSFQGFHAKDILVIFDEATGIDANIWTMAEGLMTSGNVKFVAIANPTSRNTRFFQCFRDALFKKIYLNCFDSPNLIANGFISEKELLREIEYTKTLHDDAYRERLNSYKEPVPYLISSKWVVSNVRKWGPTHPLSISKAFGRFPKVGDKVLIDLNDIENAQNRVVDIKPPDIKLIGVDVARYGTDASVITCMTGYKQTALSKFHKRDTVFITGEVINHIREYGCDVVAVDATGIGAGVLDNLVSAQLEGAISKKIEIREIQFGARAGDLDDNENLEKYVNLKARAFDALAKDIRDHIQLLREDVYTLELPAIQYGYNAKGQMVLETKDQFKRRTQLDSPDASDSLAICNFGRYDYASIGSFGNDNSENSGDDDFGVPFAHSLGGKRLW